MKAFYSRSRNYNINFATHSLVISPRKSPWGKTMVKTSSNNFDGRNKKGLLLWTYIITFLTIVMLIFFIQTVFGSIDENVRISAQLNAEEIAAVINIMQASPSNIEYTISLPKTDCFVKIDRSAVRFATPKSEELKSTKDFSLCNERECFTAYITSTKISIDIRNIIECKETKLTLTKCSNKIIKGVLGDCR